MRDSCDFSAFTAHCLEDNILHLDFKKIKNLTAKDVQEVFTCYEKIGSGSKIYALVTFNGFIPMSDDAMAEAKKQSKRNLQAATAFVVRNFALRMSINFFAKFYMQSYPITITATIPEGISWLKHQKKKVS